MRHRLDCSTNQKLSGVQTLFQFKDRIRYCCPSASATEMTESVPSGWVSQARTAPLDHIWIPITLPTF